MNAPLFVAQVTAPATGLDFDWGTAVVTVITGALAYFGTRAVKRSDTKSVSRNEVVDDTVLGRFIELQNRVSHLEVELERAFDEIGRLQSRETDLEGKVDKKDAEIISLRLANAELREQIETFHGDVDGRAR